MNNTNTTIIEKYIDSLSNLEKKALKIAQQQLETSFDIEKSIGFIKFKNNQKES